MNTTPNAKIRSGLDKIERQKSGTTFKLANLIGAPASVFDLGTLASQATSKRDRLKELSESITTAIENHKAQKTAEYADVGKTRDGSLITDSLGDNQRRTMIEREVNAFTRDARKLSAEERSKLMVEIAEITSKIAAVKSSWADPVAILMGRTLADPNRATYTQNLANAGPVAVENAMRDAAISGDAALASSAIDRLSSMGRDAKLVRFSKNDIAEALVSEDWTKANRFIAVVDLAATESELAQTQAEGGRNIRNLKLRVGMLRNELTALVGDVDPTDLIDKPGEPKPKVKPLAADVKPRSTDEIWNDMVANATETDDA